MVSVDSDSAASMAETQSKPITYNTDETKQVATAKNLKAEQIRK